MNNIELKLDEKGYGQFYIPDAGKTVAWMEISISKDSLTAYHTEVLPEYEGKGLAKKLLANMVDYARTHKLMVTPLCPYVYAQFKRHPEEYRDIWQQIDE